MTRRLTAVAILVGALGITACSTGPVHGSGSEGGSSCDVTKGTLVVGMIAPLSGGVSALGLGMRNSAKLAVDQANQLCTVPGYRLELQAEDDQSMDEVAALAATKLSSNASVVGIVGTLNSSTALVVQPIVAAKKIVQVSPANTNPVLTLGPRAATAPARPFPSYFRLSATDLQQGPFGARYLFDKARKRNIAVIDDGKTYGAGLADQAATEIATLGGKVVARLKVGENDTDFAGVIAKIRPLNPDAVYYGGEYPVAGRLSAQLADAGLNIPLMGGDGIVDDTFGQLGGKDGDLATGVGAPEADLSTAKAFTQEYKAANFAEPSGIYGVLTYDSTTVIIRALAGVVAGGTFDDTKRQALVDAVQATSMDGASGKVAFDRYGDTITKQLTVYSVQGGKFEPVETGTFPAG